MGTDELKACMDAVELLENYRSFGSMVGEAIVAFKRIEECIEDPTTEKKDEAKRLISRLSAEIGPYQGYVPSVAVALEKLKKWSEQD
ncbi:hypothetical protein HN807_06600 [Candidatus Bathyarchaeota archaeon]|jgi:hypothetical protein|nr:hypothetical protein [Candidatus Bathyarchaeota archaeon]MBT4319881.1 hypothetical protein [Candidatus Bathyarchaeota archaeon]MBT4423963.1 hypothetical protein [Candidatus Bathyarchaeota archaeon]MBT5642001.1 hypothetical protein [Candidatus Bathyarchaeota archaeon]MBT6605668.1 hypothetical protein [Candidatus Bathyarchaeota archaeon]